MGLRTNFSIFYVALLDQFQWSRGTSAGVQSLALIVYTICAPIVGTLIDRYGPQTVISIGVLILSTGLMLCASIQSLAHFFLFYGVIAGVGITSIGIISYSAVIAHWFEKKRGLASGIALSGMGLGTFLFVPLAQQLIFYWGWLSDRIGREATFTLGACCCCLGYASLLIMAVNDGQTLFAYTFCAFFGIGWGATAPIFMVVSADLFKGRIFGLIFGIVEGGIGLASAFGAWIAGFIFDTTGSYQWAFCLAIVLTIVSVFSIWVAAPRNAQSFRQDHLNMMVLGFTK
jgi:MFS family permease